MTAPSVAGYTETNDWLAQTGHGREMRVIAARDHQMIIAATFLPCAMAALSVQYCGVRLRRVGDKEVCDGRSISGHEGREVRHEERLCACGARNT